METIRQILTKKGNQVFSVTPETTVYDTLKLMADKNIGAVLVLDEGKLVGIMSERDYARKVILHGKFSKEIPVGKGEYGTVGDCWDRYYMRILEMEESLKIVEQAIDQIPDGDVSSAIPKRVKPPAGQIYSRVENPRGELGYFIISDGSVNPTRVKVRAPSFVNMGVFGELCKGHMIADVVAILGSIDIVLGEIDR
ncbi:MAG: CBS domain-containing protein [Bacteroidetes bacterium]|nr:CBS domain-containing protein [Bacteroidota bacterium]